MYVVSIIQIYLKEKENIYRRPFKSEVSLKSPKMNQLLKATSI